MTFQKEVQYTSQSISPPPRRHSKSKSPARDRRRSRSQDPVDSGNPGNNLYVTGLSTRVAAEDLEKYFNKEGKVTACEVVLDPRPGIWWIRPKVITTTADKRNIL